MMKPEFEFRKKQRITSITCFVLLLGVGIFIDSEVRAGVVNDYPTVFADRLVSNVSLDVGCPKKSVSFLYNEDNISSVLVDACGKSYRYVPTSQHCSIDYAHSSRTLDDFKRHCSFVNASLGINK